MGPDFAMVAERVCFHGMPAANESAPPLVTRNALATASAELPVGPEEHNEWTSFMENTKNAIETLERNLRRHAEVMATNSNQAATLTRVVEDHETKILQVASTQEEPKTSFQNGSTTLQAWQSPSNSVLASKLPKLRT